MIRQKRVVDDAQVSAQGIFESNRGQVYGALGGAALEESVTGFLFRATGRRLGALTGTAGDLLQPELANEQFGIDGLLSFEKPVYADHAKQLFSIKQRELMRSQIISQGNTGTIENFAVSLAASVIDPIGDAVALIPYVGIAVKSRGLHSSTKAMTLGQRVRRGALEGASAGFAQELVIAPLAKYSENRNYGIENMMLSLVLSSGLGALARGVDPVAIASRRRARVADTETAAVASRTELAPSPEELPDIVTDPLAGSSRKGDQDPRVVSDTPLSTRVIPDAPGAELVVTPDVPQATRKAAFDAAVHQVASGEPVTSGDILDAAQVARANKQLSEVGQPIRVRTIKDSAAFDSSDIETSVSYAIAELDDLVPSHTDSGRVNPKYPSVLQPRDREAGASQAQIQKIASRLTPERLGESPLASEGAPIISPDGIIESGNGRTLALRKARNEGMAGARKYQEYLKAQGYDVDGFDFPVLVRVTQGDRSAQDRVDFAVRANARTTASLNVTDQGKADAGRIPDEFLNVEIDGDLSSVANRKFLTDILRLISTDAELPSLIGKDGEVSADGLRRVKAALTAKAYDDPLLLTDILESTSPDAKAINNALVETAPKWAHMRALARSGQIDASMDITEHLLSAVALVRRMRQMTSRGERVTLTELEAETSGSLFGPARAATERMALQFLYGPSKSKDGTLIADSDPLTRPNSQVLVRSYLNAYIKTALSTKGGPSLFGDSADAPSQTPQDVIAQITGQAVQPERSAGASAGRSGDGAGDPVGQSRDGESGELFARSQSPERDGDGKSSSENPTELRENLTDAGSERVISDTPSGPAERVENDIDRSTVEGVNQANEGLAKDLEALIDSGLVAKEDVDALRADYDPAKLTDLQKGIRGAALCVLKGGAS